jgi:2-phospho-L-lactate transferase/gluconeogenesis factor (CofD/UPF0052 family)
MERDQVRDLKLKLADAHERSEALAADVSRLQTAIEDGRQIGAHDTAELFARTRTLLTGRLSPMLDDAADALEIEPPIIEVAQDRITSMRTIIKGEVAWLDKSSA